MQTRAYWQLITTAAIWGLSWLCGRIISAQGIAANDASLARFLFGSLGLLAVMLTQRQWPLPTRAGMLKLAAMGLFGVYLYNLCFFLGLRTVPAGRGSLIASLQPAFVFLIAAILWRERPSAQKFSGLALGLVGAAIVLSQGDFAKLMGDGLGGGDLWLLGCAACWATYTVIGRTLMSELPPIPATAYSTWLGTAMLAGGSLAQPVSLEAWKVSTWLAASCLGLLGTAVAFLLYLRGVQQIGPARAAIFLNLVPVFAMIYGAVWLGEPIHMSTAAGGALVIGGVYLLNR